MRGLLPLRAALPARAMLPDKAGRVDDERGAPAGLDPRALARIHELGGPDLLAELVASFVASAPRALAAAGDAATAARLMHQLKSSAAQLGLGRVSALAGEAEAAATTGSEPAAAGRLGAALQALGVALQEVLPELEARAGVGAGEAARGQSSNPLDRSDQMSRSDPGPAPALPWRIAAVEDNPDNRLVLRALLGKRAVLAEYTSGEQALPALRRDPPDLVLLDISLPGMDGLAVLAAMRADPVLARVPVMALTAHAMAGDRDRYLAAGFRDYASKPIVDREAFLAAVAGCIRGARELVIAPAFAAREAAAPPTPAPRLGGTRLRGPIALIAAAALLVVSGGLAYRAHARANDLLEQIARSQTALIDLESSLALVSAAEAGMRGYVITGDEEYLKSYRGASSRIRHALLALDTSHLINPAQLDELERLFARRTELMKRTVELRRRQGFAAAQELMRKNEGLELMAQIRESVQRLRADQYRQVAERSTAASSTARLNALAILLGAMAAVLLVLFTFRTQARELESRRQAETAQREARAAAEKANAAKSAFLAAMSHELRTPLNSVLGLGDAMLAPDAEAPLAPVQRQYLERIRANAAHLLELINQVLDLARIEAQRAEIARQPVDLAALVRETLGALGGRLVGRAVTLRSTLPPRLAPLETDPVRLKQVLINLVDNAIKFTPRGEIELRVLADAASGAAQAIEVRDPGIGIPEERQVAVFEAFEQGDIEIARRHGGSGLGLAITRSLCRQLGYRVELESQVGRGSTFRVVLAPATAPATTAAPAPVVSSGSRPGNS